MDENKGSTRTCYECASGGRPVRPVCYACKPFTLRRRDAGNEGKRYKPGDIVTLRLTGEKVMVLVAEPVHGLNTPELYHVRGQDMRRIEVDDFELAPVAAGDTLAECPRLAQCEAWDKAREDNFERMQKVWAAYDAEKAALSSISDSLLCL